MLLRKKRTFRFQSSCKECAYPGGPPESGGTYRENIVFGGTVTGSVTADLDHVTPKEALHAMLVSQGLIAREEGACLLFWGIRHENGGRATKSYKLSYAEAKEVAEGIRQLSDSVHVAYNQTANAVILSGTPLEIMETAAVLRSLDVPENR